MNRILDRLTRALTCVATASAITLVAGLAFVQSTNNAPGTHPVARAAVVAPLYA